MMNYNDIVMDIAEHADRKEMIMLTEDTSEFIEEARKKMPEEVERFLMKLDLHFNPSFTKESACYAVACMENKDGTTGEHWSLSETTKILEEKNYHFNKYDFYYTLNMIYSDYCNKDFTKDVYVGLACDFLNDKDGTHHKAKKYYNAVNNH